MATTTLTLSLHPVAEIYPEMASEEYQSLLSDIQANGLRQPIVLHDGQIVDGRHRWRAICELREQGFFIEPRFEEWDGQGDLLNFVHSLNFHRRHLSVTQKACIGVGYKRAMQEIVKPGGDRKSQEYQGGNISTLILDAPKVRDLAAAKVGVSGKTVDAAEKVAASAPDLFEQMQTGKTSVWDAQRELRRRETAQKRQETVEMAQSLPPTVRVIHADVEDGLQELLAEGKQFPLIIADPPYNQGVAEWDKIPVYKQFCLKWIQSVSKLLPPGGSLFVFGTFRSLIDVFIAADWFGLLLQTEITWDYINGAGGNWPRRHDIILWFVKPGADPLFNRDSVQVERHEAHIREYKGHEYFVKTPGTVWRFPTVDGASHERTNHPTQKPLELIRRIVLASSNPGDLVLDPFAGSGTTLVAALEAGRQAVGIEINSDYCEIIHARTATRSEK